MMQHRTNADTASISPLNRAYFGFLRLWVRAQAAAEALSPVERLEILTSRMTVQRHDPRTAISNGTSGPMRIENSQPSKMMYRSKRVVATVGYAGAVGVRLSMKKDI